MNITTFRQYYDSYYDQLYHFLTFYTKNSIIIEDVLQEIFLKLWENREKIEVKYIKTYLFHAAKNKVLNHLRDEQSRHYLLENWFYQQQYESKGKDCFDLELFILQLDKIVKQLPERCREIFLLSREEKLTYKQIADKLNLSVKTVEVQMGIALKRIRESLSSSTFLVLIAMGQIIHN